MPLLLAKLIIACTVVVAAVLTGGCATVPREAGFGDVQQLVSARGLPRINWNQSSQEDAAASQAIGQLLATELTADSVVQIAILNNPSLQSTYEDLSVAQADLVQAGLLKNPVFQGDFRFHEGTGDLAFEGSLVQNFIDLFLIPLRKRVAEAQFEAAKFRVAGEVMDLAAQTRSAFYSLQADEQLADMYDLLLHEIDDHDVVVPGVIRVGELALRIDNDVRGIAADLDVGLQGQGGRIEDQKPPTTGRRITLVHVCHPAGSADRQEPLAIGGDLDIVRHDRHGEALHQPGAQINDTDGPAALIGGVDKARPGNRGFGCRGCRRRVLAGGGTGLEEERHADGCKGPQECFEESAHVRPRFLAVGSR